MYFHIKNYEEDLRHHRQILIKMSWNAPYVDINICKYTIKRLKTFILRNNNAEKFLKNLSE